MKCEMQHRMACNYSVPTGRRTRYRTYKCEFCGEQLATVEIPVTWLDYEPMEKIEKVVELRKAVKQARLKRGFIMNRIKTKKGDAPAGAPPLAPNVGDQS